MTNKKDFIELGEWQLNAFKQRDKYRQALEEIRNNIKNNVCLLGERCRDFPSECANGCKHSNLDETINYIENKINEALNDRD